MKPFPLAIGMILVAVLLSSCTTESPRLRFASDAGCAYIFKTTNDYFGFYRSGVATREIETGKFQKVFSGWPQGLADVRLDQGYILSGGGCAPFSETYTEVVINATKQSINASFGYPGCLMLEKAVYPQCYGDQQKSDDPTCRGIFEKERREDTSICTTHEGITPEDAGVLDEHPFSEFYLCDKSTDERTANALIESGRLEAECEKVV